MSEALQPPTDMYRGISDETLSNKQIQSLVDTSLTLDDIRRVGKEQRPTLIIDGVIRALHIAPRLDDLLEDSEILPGKEADVERAIEIDGHLADAKLFLDQQRQVLSHAEFGDMMMDVLESVQEHHRKSNLYRAMEHLRAITPGLYRDELTQAHRLLLVALYIDKH